VPLQFEYYSGKKGAEHSHEYLFIFKHIAFFSQNCISGIVLPVLAILQDVYALKERLLRESMLMSLILMLMNSISVIPLFLC